MADMNFGVNLLPTTDLGFDLGSNSKRWNNIYGILKGNADTATKLATARSLKTNLGSTTAITFDGSANQDSIPITGTLGTANGGTGNTSFTANRLVWTETETKLTAGYHYADNTKVAINSTTEPTENFYVNGTAKITGTLNAGNNIELTSNNEGANIRLITAGNTNNLYKFDTSNNELRLYYSINGGDSVSKGWYFSTDGIFKTPQIKITDTDAVKHIEFARANYNYITAPASGSIAFITNGKALGAATADLLISNNQVAPGTTNTVNLGTSKNKWANAYATTFHGALDGNADTATNADKLDGKHLSEIAAAKSTTLAWGTQSTIATIGGNNIDVILPAVSNTNTAHTTFAWTDGTTAGPTGSLSGNHAAVSFSAIPSASDSTSGIVTTGEQSFAGNKTFNDNFTGNGKIIFGANNYGAVLPSSGVEGQVFFQLSEGDFVEGGGGGGVPAGGTAGQIIIKNSDEDYDAGWANMPDMSKLGTETIGGPNQNFYLNAGTPTAGNSFVPTTGGTFSGPITFANNTMNTIGDDCQLGDQNIAGCIVLKGTNGATGIQFNPYSGSTSQKISIDGAGMMTITGNLTATKVYGAVWNDYAEYRESNITEPGRVVFENGDDTLSLSTERLQRGCEIISDTFGFAIGETDKCKTPIAASGRVLAYPLESREEFAAHIGWPVCSGPNGTVSLMTEEEEEKYPSRIIGTVSAVPDYDEWGTGNVKVNGRVWIRIR